MGDKIGLIAMKLKNKIRIARTKKTIQDINNHGLLVYVPRKYKKIAVLLMVNAVIWTMVWGGLQIIMAPREIYIVAGANAEVVEAGSPVSTIGRDSIEESHAEVKSQESNLSQPDIEEMIASYFPEVKNKAISVFKCESGLNPSKHSDVDLMSDGRAFSIGLTQQNLTVTKINNLDCPKAFQGINKSARVIDEKLYQKCVNLAENPKISLEIARNKYERNGFDPWRYCNNKTN